MERCNGIRTLDTSLAGSLAAGMVAAANALTSEGPTSLAADTPGN